jgi:hypothetical protein
MSRNLLGCACAAALALTATVAAQNPPNPPAQDPPRPTAASPASQDDAKVTIEGCLVREEDVPGRKPNVAERAGISEDYILTEAKIVKGAPASGQADKPTGTSGMSPMYEVQGLDDEKLKEHVGRRVQIEGTLARTDRPASPADTDELRELRATSVRPASGECKPVK